MFEIIKNVPVPERTALTGSCGSKYPFAAMEIGDMFFVPNMEKNNLATHASMVGKKLGRKFTTRLVEMGGVKGIGVWRLSDPAPAAE